MGKEACTWEKVNGHETDLGHTHTESKTNWVMAHRERGRARHRENREVHEWESKRGGHAGTSM